MLRFAILTLLVGVECASTPAAPPPVAPASREPLLAGLDYLVKQQSPDGAWRSDLYAAFKDGPALTPLVVVALYESNEPGAPAAAARKGSEYLASLVQADGSIADGDGDIDYPVYTAALSVIALSHPENADLRKARDAWLKYLLDRQLTEKLGWKPEDKHYGGWGYCRLLPRKPEPGTIAPPLIESNLSATVFALEALHAAKVQDRERYEAAAVFVRRCQNWEPLLPGPRSPGADNGFYFISDNPVRNKAGERDPNSPFRFHSYGSTTADGLRGLLLSGEKDASRISGAKGWLAAHFKADSHPGVYVPAHERNREAVYYYYAASVSKSLRIADAKESGKVEWAKALAAELGKRQRPDGSWMNPIDLVRENEPLVATSNAAIALANCQRGG